MKILERRFLVAASVSVIGLLPLAIGADAVPNGLTRGDSNGDGKVDIGDAVSTICFLFLGDPCGCLDAADVNGDRAVDLSDPIGLLGFLFLGGGSPKPPFPACGLVEGDDPALGCEEPNCTIETVRLGLEYPCAQCQECSFFPSLEDAVAELTAAGIEVLSAKIGAAIPGIAVCLACGCPSNRAYWIEVPPGDAEAAIELGWRTSFRLGWR